MNILDTFFYMFEADTSKMKKGTDEADKSAKGLTDTLNKTDKAADQLSKNFVEMAKNGARAVAAVFALGAIKTLVNDTAALTAAQALQAQAMGVNVTQMTAYQAAIVSVGGTADGAAASLAGLRDKFVEMSRFGAMVGPEAFMFRQLGLSAKDMADSINDPTIALSKLAKTFETLNQTQRLFIGQKLGLDQGTISLLSQGQQAFDDMIAKQKELNAVTKEQADLAVKYKLAQNELGLTFETVKREIVTQLLPAFTWIVKGLSEGIQWLREHKEFAIAAFTGIAVAIGVVLLPPLIAATAAMWAFIAPILLAAAPFIALGVAIGLVIDDIAKFNAGQKSLIGDILERWPLIGQIAKAVAQIVSMAWDVVGTQLGTVAKLIKEDVAKAFDYLRTVMQPLNAVWQNFIDLVGKLWDKFKGAPINILNWIGNTLARATGGHYDNIGSTGAPGGTPAGSSTGADAARLGNSASGRTIADWLVANGGWTREQAAGIAGSFMQESGGRADAVNKSSGAYGLAQWLGSRVKDFKEFSGKDLQGSTLEEQLAFFNYETTRGKERAAGDRIRAAKTAEEAAIAHRKYYERPGAHEAEDARRVAYANMILAGQQQVKAANTPLASQSSAAISNSNRSSTLNVTGPTTINTQATDSKAIAETWQQELSRTWNDALDYHDNGVAA